MSLKSKGNLNKPTVALINLMNQLNNFTDDEKQNELKLPNCNYGEIDYFQKLSKNFKRKTLSFFHMNVCPLTKNFVNFNILLNDLNINFDILAVNEPRIKKDSSSPLNLHLDNYLIEQTPTETSAGGTLLYISKRLSYQLRNDLKLYHPGKIESTFIEIIFSKSTNVIVGCIYKHPALQINDSKSDFISPLLLKLQKESSQRIFLLGDFNIDLLKCKLSDSINNFIDTPSSTYNFLLPHIPLPTRISTKSTLIDNIFSDSTSLEETESGNVTSTFSDHFPQFIFLKDFFSKIPAAKSNILRHDWRKFESSKFISDFDQIDWEQILCSGKSDVNFSMNKYLSKIDSLLETHAPLKKLNKKELKFLTKP